ncbi:MAG: hypothetical protein RI897_2193 [Verrucomicrobiota bacterium]
MVGEGSEGEGEHLEGEDFDDGELVGGGFGGGECWYGVIGGDEEGWGVNLLEVLVELLVEGGVRFCALEDEYGGGGGGHFDGAVAESGATHGFDAEAGGFFADEGAGVGCGERGAATEQEDISGWMEMCGEVVQVAAPMIQVSG